MPPLSQSLVAAALAALLVLTACGAGDTGPDDGPQQSPGAESGPEDYDAEAERRQQEQQRLQEMAEEYDAALAGPAAEHVSEAEAQVRDMPLAQQAGQVLIGEYQGADAESAAALIEELHLAGVILMGHNIPGGADAVDTAALAEQISTISAADSAAETPDQVLPPIVSVDQEGGLVTRVGSPLTEWPTPMAYGAAASADAEEGAQLARSGHRGLAEELHELGFTVSFAPTADVTVGAADPTIGSRSFGSDEQTVAELAQEGVRGLAEGGLAGSIKHFPGHGSVADDSHYTLPLQESSIEELRSRDWVPFAETIEAGVPMVMMGHIEVPALEAGVPSSLSPTAYAEIRRMGHDGVIVTDAMNMAAVADRYGGDQAAVGALAAGADLLLMPSSAHGAQQAIRDAVDSGQLPAERLSEAAARVIALKLWHQDLASGELAAGPGSDVPEDLAAEIGRLDAAGAATAEQTAAAAVTLVQGRCEAVVVEDAIQVAGGTEQDRARLTAAAERAGVQTGWGPTVTLLGGSAPGSGDVVVALDRPEALADSAAETKIALYGRTPESFDALLQVLTGSAAAGALPVAVGGEGIGHTAC